MAIALKMMTLQEAAQAAGVGVRFDYEGKQYKLCKNGSILDMGSGKFAWGNAPVDTRISTSEQSRAMLYERWHGQRQEAARQAVQHALNDDRIDSIEAADAYMTYAIVREGVLDGTQRLDHRLKAWEMVLEQSGMDGRAPKQAQNTPSGALSMTVSVDAETAQRLLAALLAAKGPNA